MIKVEYQLEWQPRKLWGCVGKYADGTPFLLPAARNAKGLEEKMKVFGILNTATLFLNDSDKSTNYWDFYKMWMGAR